jgi:hypothetical protein
MEDLGDLVWLGKISGARCFSDMGREIFLRKFCKYLVSSSYFSPTPERLLSSFPARSKTLAKLGMDWQELLKRASASDD